jgi:hypothetical protein
MEIVKAGFPQTVDGIKFASHHLPMYDLVKSTINIYWDAYTRTLCPPHLNVAACPIDAGLATFAFFVASTAAGPQPPVCNIEIGGAGKSQHGG